ncbi:L,D-transpeptidase family protein [Rhizosphaericola mali]|uniref:L,D-transpeptidase family protein n=1 Tax=Rhizosphaericola mali TaxID=2545455 RepID=A0A5P2G2V0_9BACT|nr:L,D-transpeptidase family protein [Rhizosphaericola mali]QES89048.1 L,D-transpeptidase family protein [Rhizosphaericola mali]
MIRPLKNYLLLAIGLTVLFLSCKEKEKKEAPVAVQDTSITEKTSFNNIFIDSNLIKQYVASDKALSRFQEPFLNFYKERNFESAWFDSTGLIEQAGNFISLINNYMEQNHDSSLYDKRLYELYDEYKNAKNISSKHLNPHDINAELYFTGSFFKYTSKLYGGSNIDATQIGWFIPRKKIDLKNLLDSSLKSGGNAQVFDQLLNPAYKKLNEYFLKYAALKKEHPDWNNIVVNINKLQLNDQNPAIPEIKERLSLLEDLSDNDGSDVFDENMQEAVKSYQNRMGLSADGVIGPGFVRSINTPLDTLIRKILVNLERTRWLPSTLPETYIWVNIPEYKLHVYENGEPNFDMRVIVGSAAHGTVIFTGNLKYIVFAPYWNVPMSIIKNEIIPGIARDPNYIASHNMEITGYNKKGEPVDVRQKPGENNALGTVKFLFPNDYDIYLHDTPNHDLFTSSNRGLSHGCIRLSDPPKMARFLLRNDSTRYTSNKIDSLMHKNKVETWVTVKNPVPVYLVYFTSWVDDDGKLNFRNDIYGHDKKVADKLF